jgi:flagellar protein FliO/FliZ
MSIVAVTKRAMAPGSSATVPGATVAAPTPAAPVAMPPALANPGATTVAVPGQQALATGAPGAGDAFGVLFALALVIAMIVALAWLLRKLQGVRGVAGQDLRVRGGVAVGARERVVMVEANGKLFMLGVAPGSVRHLADLGEASAIAVAPVTNPATSPFAQLLKRLSSGHTAGPASN